MSFVTTTTRIPAPACARLAAACAAADGDQITCPSARGGTCPTLSAVRRMSETETGAASA